MFGSTSLSKIKLLVQKVVFTRHIAKVSGEDKLIICFFAFNVILQQLASTFSFNLLMSKRAYDVFVVVINFLNHD